MGLYTFQRTQFLPADLPTVWRFISDPRNLSLITPPSMRLRIRKQDLPASIYPGMLIAYTVAPIWNVPLRWVTEITHVEQEKYFVDEQRMGPYALWHHEHFLQPLEGGVEMTDIVTYQPPFGPIGDLANKLFLHGRLEDIFSYRRRALESRFGAQ